MSTFNLKHIISRYNLNENNLAIELFPGNKFPNLALKRIVSGDSFLDTKQIEILAKIIGVPVKDLFMSEDWTFQQNSNIDKFVFVKNDYRAELIRESLITNIYHKDRLLAKETIIVDKNIILSEYLELVNQVIIKLI